MTTTFQEYADSGKDTMLNQDIYSKPPASNRLLNNGVAEVSEDRSEGALQVLRYELETFVCDGQYATGLETILEKFLDNLGRRSEQPGVWISGFYGSGKSHLAKMLRALWTDVTFPDGATARSLPRLPEGIREKLKELSTLGRREGGLHAAAGKLGAGAGDRVRLALLGLLFKSQDLPEQYNQARFVLWCRDEGLLDGLKVELESRGRTLAQELLHMYVSPHLAGALRKLRPDLGNSDADVRQTLKTQFPQVTDVTSDQLIRAIESALGQGGRLPLTLVALDEVQQYIGSDPDKAFQVQEITETLSKHFQGRLLFVGTGQSALSGTATLTKLIGRFPVQVTLGDWDVENVTRQIILAKKPSAQPQVEQVWRTHLGEISRHLRGTKLEHVTADEEWLTADYPLLPVRRRFWERVLRSIDATGTVAQLRSQLRVVHEAVLATAGLPLGHVVGADFLYDQIATSLLSTAQLPKEVFENIQRFSAGDQRAQLKGRLLRLVYLINKLPADTAQDLGLRATEVALADLLITDLAAGSAELRGQLPGLLAELQNQDRLIMSLEGSQGLEYRLQTRESGAWHEEFRAQEAELRSAPQRLEHMRVELLKGRFQEILRKVRVSQGRENVERTLQPTYDETLPKDHAQRLYLWIQNGWQSDERAVLAEARARGAENPTLFAFLPAQHKTELAQALVWREAARATLQRKGNPSTAEGQDAQRSMESRLKTAEEDLKGLLDRLFAGVRLFQAGGQEVTEGADLADRIQRAARASAVRLYPQFDAADHDRWGKVLEEARKGAAEALKQVGHTQATQQHPVCQRILTYLGPGKRGSEIREHFEAPPYGWSRDAIDGALYALLGEGHLRARDASGRDVEAPALDRPKLSQANFRRESVHITPVHLIKIRSLFSAVGVPCQPKEESAKAPTLLARLKEQAQAAGGPPPAPESPRPQVLAELEGLSGNALLLELFQRGDELVELSKTWRDTAERIHRRLPAWRQLEVLLREATALEGFRDLKAEADALLSQRKLLAEPDLVKPLLDRVVEDLRAALKARVETCQETFAQQQRLLEASPDWARLTEAERSDLLRVQSLRPLEPVEFGTPEQLHKALAQCNLEHWRARAQALPQRFEAARMQAVKRHQPTVQRVTLPRRTLNDHAELAAWLAEVEALLAGRLDDGPVTF